jgi:hypothetical protein
MIMAVMSMEIVIDDQEGVSLIASWVSNEPTLTLALSKSGESARFIDLDVDQVSQLERFLFNWRFHPQKAEE